MGMWSLWVVIVMNTDIESGEVDKGVHRPAMWRDGSGQFQGRERSIADAAAVNGSVVFLVLPAVGGIRRC